MRNNRLAYLLGFSSGKASRSSIVRRLTIVTRRTRSNTMIPPPPTNTAPPSPVPTAPAYPGSPPASPTYTPLSAAYQAAPVLHAAPPSPTSPLQGSPNNYSPDSPSTPNAPITTMQGSPFSATASPHDYRPSSPDYSPSSPEYSPASPVRVQPGLLDGQLTPVHAPLKREAGESSVDMAVDAVDHDFELAVRDSIRTEAEDQARRELWEDNMKVNKEIDEFLAAVRDVPDIDEPQKAGVKRKASPPYHGKGKEHCIDISDGDDEW